MPHLARKEDREAILSDLYAKAGVGIHGRSWGRGGARQPGGESRDGYLVGNSETKAWLRQFKFI